MNKRFPILLFLATLLMGATPTYYVYQSTWADGGPRSPMVPVRMDSALRGPANIPILGTDAVGRLRSSPVLSGDAGSGAVRGVRGTNVSNGQDAVALGALNQAWGNQSAAEGLACYAGGNYSVAKGFYCYSGGLRSIAIGTRDSANGLESIVLGSNNKANGSQSFVGGGVGNVAHYRQTIFGAYSPDDSIADDVPTVGQKILKLGWNGNDVFYVNDSGYSYARNLDARKASFKIAMDATYPTSETLANLTFAADQQPGLLIPANFLKVGSSRQVTVKLRLGWQPRFPGCGMKMFVRTNSTSNGSGLDGTIVGQTYIDMNAFNNAIANYGYDVDVELWVGAKIGGTNSALPIRSHMNCKSNLLALNQNSSNFNSVPFGASGYEAQTVIDATVDNRLYVSYAWDPGLAYRAVGVYPTDGNEWVFSRTGGIDIPGKPGASNSYLTPVRVGITGGGTVYAVGLRATTGIVGGSSGAIRKSSGARDTWSPRRSPQTANAWRACFYSSWLSRWILVGDGGAIAYSNDDGDTWTAATSGVTDALFSIAGTSSTGLHVGTSTSGKRLYSTDGITWSSATDLSAIGAPKYCKAFGSNVLFAGSAGRAAYSTDNGSTWTAKTTGIGSASFVGCDYDSTLGLWSLISGSGGYTAATFAGTWSAVSGLGSATLNAFGCSGLGTCVGADNTGVLWQSTNGTAYADITTTVSGSGTFWGDFGYQWQ